MTDFGLLLVKALASLFSVAMMLSPALQIRRVYIEKHTGEMALMPLAGLFLCCHTWMVYGFVSRDYFPLVVTYLVGFVAGAVYVTVYYRYTTEKVYARRVIFVTLALVVVVSTYAILGESGVIEQSANDLEQVMGYVVTGTTIVLYTSPFETIARVIKTKSAASIPVLMCACASLSNTLWITYGLLEHDAFVWGLGVFCVAFALVQVVLYTVYNPAKLLCGAEGGAGDAAAFDIMDKHELAIAIESPCFAAIKSPLAPLH